jgi:hypothetical protein
MSYKESHYYMDIGLTEEQIQQIEDLGYEDDSWHNNAMPSWGYYINKRDEPVLTIWIDDESGENSEIYQGHRKDDKQEHIRFMLGYQSWETDSEDIYMGNDFEELLKHAKEAIEKFIPTKEDEKTKVDGLIFAQYELVVICPYCKRMHKEKTDTADERDEVIECSFCHREYTANFERDMGR